ncbi:MAG: tetratricopeptide repeat protein, partial [Phycisphaerales bacterium JB065]
GADAEALLRNLCDRIGDHAGDLAKECGYLAQAITLAGGVLAERPSLSVERYIERLKDARLEQLDRYSEEGERTIAASIALSEALLKERDPELARRWRMLCVFPGDFDAMAAGVVWDAEGDEAEDALVELHRFSVIEWDEETGRYRLHDLVRDYTGAQCEERFDAGLRHAKYFSFVLDTANQWYQEPGGERTMDGLALYDRERENIEAGFDWACSHQEQSKEALALVDRYPGAASILSIRQSTRDRESWLRAALAAAEKARLQERIAQHSGNLGIILMTRGDLDGADAMYRKSLAISEDLRHTHGRANVYGNLGIILRIRGDLDGAETMHRKALAISEELGHKQGVASACGNLGELLMTRGDFNGAQAMHGKSLDINEEIGHKAGIAYAYGNLGVVLMTRGDLGGAEALHRKSLVTNEEIGHKEGIANAYGNLGIIFMTRGDLDGAEAMFRESLDIEEQIGRKEGIASASGNLGIILSTRGDLDEAETMFRNSLGIEKQIGRKEGIANAFTNLGAVAEMRGQISEARRLWTLARDLFREIGALPMVQQVQQWLDELPPESA